MTCWQNLGVCNLRNIPSRSCLLKEAEQERGPWPDTFRLSKVKKLPSVRLAGAFTPSVVSSCPWSLYHFRFLIGSWELPLPGSSSRMSPKAALSL